MEEEKLTLTREGLKEKIDSSQDFVLADARGQGAYEQEHLPSAVSVPMSNVAERVKELSLDKEKEIVVYCSSFTCNASPITAEKLRKLGFKKVLDYEGGIADWKEAGYPTEKA